MRSSQNALVHGACTNAVREDMKKLKELLRDFKSMMSELDLG
jgi:hypothetical protein